jgi:hypothetical protein
MNILAAGAARGTSPQKHVYDVRPNSVTVLCFSIFFVRDKQRTTIRTTAIDICYAGVVRVGDILSISPI